MCGSIRNDIGIDEAIALDSFPDMHGNGRREYRPGRDHRMELRSRHKGRRHMGDCSGNRKSNSRPA